MWEEVFLIDLLVIASRSAGESLNVATDEFLKVVFWSEGVYKFGFSFVYDVKCMKVFYFYLSVWEEKSWNFVDVK